MIPEIGQFALVIALLLALTQATLPLIGASRGNRAWIALAAPAVVPLLLLALAATAVAPLSESAAAALTWLNGWCAAYLAAVARLVGGLPFAQIQSTRSLLVLLAVALLLAAYASQRWRGSEGSST